MNTKNNSVWVVILVMIFGTVAVIGGAIISIGCEKCCGNTNLSINGTPKKPTLEITKPVDGKIDAIRKKIDNAAYFPVEVNASGLTLSSGLGIYIIVFEEGDWYIQNHKEIKAEYQEIEAWSGGGKKNDAKVGTQVKVRAVVANINFAGEYMKNNQTVSEDAKELKPIALSNSITATIKSIK